MCNIHHFHYALVIQNGRREHWNVGGTFQQQREVCGLCAQLQLLPVWLHRELLNRTLPIASTDDLFV